MLILFVFHQVTKFTEATNLSFEHLNSSKNGAKC